MKDTPDCMPFEINLPAGASRLVRVTPRFERAWLLRFHFEAPDLERLLVKRISVEAQEQLRVWPIPAVPIISAASGVTLELVSDIEQRVILAVEFSEFKQLRKDWS